MMTPPDALKARILAATKSRPAPTRKSSAPTIGALVALAVALSVGVLYAFGGPHHADGRPTELGNIVVVGLTILAAVASFFALPRPSSMLPRSRGQLLGVIVGAPLLLGLWIMAWHPAYADPFERLGVRCFAMTLLTAPWPFVALARWSTRIDPVHPRLSGAALGAASGAWAGVMVSLWCPLADPAHVARGHMLPFAVLALGGAALGSRLFGLRRV